MKVVFEGTFEELQKLFGRPVAAIPGSIIPFNATSQIRALMVGGFKIEAIKLHRAMYGCGLKESKEICEQLLDRRDSVLGGDGNIY